MRIRKYLPAGFFLLLFLVLLIEARFTIGGNEAISPEAYGAGKLMFGFAAFFLVVGAVVLYVFRDRWQKAPEKCFFPAAVSFGCAMILLLPAWNINDFGMHFGAAWNYSNRISGIGNKEDYMLTLREGDLPVMENVFSHPEQPFYSPSTRSYLDVKNLLFSLCENTEQVISDFGGPRATGMSFYSPWNYVPFIIVFTLLRPLGAGLVGMLLIARLCALLLYSFGIYHAIRRMPLPQGKWLMALIALLPVSMMNLTALTYDGVVLTASFLLIAAVFHIRLLPDEEVSFRDMAELLFPCFLLAALKGGGYAVLVLLTLMLCTKKIKSRKNLLVLLCFAVAVLTVLYYDVWKQIGEAPFFQFPEREGMFSAKYALSHPWLYLRMWFGTFLGNADNIFHTAVSGNFGWNENIVPEWVSIGFLACVILIVRKMAPLCADDGADEKMFRLGRMERTFLLGVVALVFLATPLTVIYGTPLESKRLYSIFGRYFIPMLLPLMLFFFYRLPHGVKNDVSVERKEESIPVGFSGFASLYMVTVYFMLITYLMR